MDQDALQCLPDCTGHGTFDLDTQSCNCEPKWSGDDCSKGSVEVNFKFFFFNDYNFVFFFLRTL